MTIVNVDRLAIPHHTWQDGSIHKGKVLLKPGVTEVVDVEVPLDKEHVLEEGSSGVAAVGNPFIEGAVRHLSEQDQRLLHDGQNLLGPQVGFLKIPWRMETRGNNDSGGSEH